MVQTQHWMTREEARALERAQRRGYLVHRNGQQCLAEEWTRHCQERAQACVRIERSGPQARVVLSSNPALDSSRQERIREALHEMGSREPGSLWPIVHRFGAYSQPFAPGQAELAAQTLVSLLQG